MKLVHAALLSSCFSLALPALAQAPASSTRDTGAPVSVPVGTAGARLTLKAGDTVVRVDESAFTPAAGLITFSEFPEGTNNPTYAPADYGADPDAPTVTFSGFFDGQRLGAADECPDGAALTGCVVNNPSNPLTLDMTAPVTFIASDAATPTSPVLSGSPLFNGPIAVLFDKDQAGVGLTGGYFDAPNSTAITVFARDGSIIGDVTNEGTEIEFLGLVTADKSETIAGLLFHLVGNEPAGFVIDNLRFGKSDQVVTPDDPDPVPEQIAPIPTLSEFGLLAMILALMAAGWTSIRRRR